MVNSAWVTSPDEVPVLGTVAWQVEVTIGGAGNCGDYFRTAGFTLVDQGTVYAASWQGLVAVDASTGAVRWRRRAVVENSAVLVGGVLMVNLDPYDNGSIGALDAATGDLLWKRANTGSVRLSAAGDLIVARSPYAMKGYDRVTGEDAWNGATFSDANQSGAATIARGRIYVSTYSDGVRAYGLLG